MLGEAGDVGVEQELDAVLAQVVVEQGRHVGIENRQDVVAALHHGHLEPALAEVLGHLEADEARAHHGDAPRPLALDEVGDAVGVLDGAQREQALAVLAGQPRHDRARAGGEDELVVALDVLAAIIEPANGDGAGLGVDGDGLLAHAHVDVEARTEALGRLQRELGAVGDGAADVVRQAAVGVAHVAGALDHDDLGVSRACAASSLMLGPKKLENNDMGRTFLVRPPCMRATFLVDAYDTHPRGRCL